MRLKNKVALITGAATGVAGELMGFGGAGAWMFAREGARVAIGDVDDERGETSARQLREQGHEALFIRLDVTQEQAWIEAIQTTISSFGKLDVLVNNAGLSDGHPVAETTEAIWDAQMNVHAKGAMFGIKHATGAMCDAGGGSIINISSINALIGSPSTAAYDAAKAAIRALTKSSAVQLAKDKIRVNAICPGYAWTPMTESSFSISETYQSRVARVPMARMANADDIAHGMVYLASDESAYVTGADLVIDGGMTAQ